MRKLLALTLVLVSNAASAEEWVVLRPPPASATVLALPGILIDASSIEVLDTGIRRAREKIDFLSRRLDEKFGPKAVSYVIFVRSYDCIKQLTHDDSMESHQIDGSINTIDGSPNPKWSPAPETRAADLTFDFVCGWKPK
jgi:hypothetical protein